VYKFSRKIALMLIIAMIFSFMAAMKIPVFAPAYAMEEQSANKDKFGITMTPPSDFNKDDGKNPYGKGKFNLNPISELHVMKSYQENIQLPSEHIFHLLKALLLMFAEALCQLLS
jgi:hypothetical protein